MLPPQCSHDLGGEHFEIPWMHKKYHTQGRGGQGIVGLFYPGEVLAPGGWMALSDAMQGNLQVLADSLGLAIALGW